jgi:hypothetical protein
MAAMYDDYGNYLGDDGLDERDAEADGGLNSSTYSGGIYTDPATGQTIDFSSLFSPFGGNTDFGKSLSQISSLFKGDSSLGKVGQIGGVAALYSLINSLGGGLGQSGQGVYKGYTGGIPKYIAERTMKDIPQTVPVAARPAVPATATQAAIPAMPATTAPRRPGSGGITYFSPMTYKDAVAAGTAAVAPATSGTIDTTVTPTGLEDTSYKVAAAGGLMYGSGGIANLGGYSDGGRLLKGPGDGVSDSIPATIGGKQPARLADGEFVIPARIVSEIGNGSTDAGAKKLYAMMDRIQGARKKSIKNVAANTKADKYLPS